MFEVRVDVIWKDWSPELEEAVARAFERYEREQSVKRFNKLVSRRGEIIPDDLEALIKARVDSYEAGEINRSDLKRYVNDYYYRIMGYDNQVAYFASLSNNSFPDFELVNIIINTEHVKLQLYERDFTYRFGGAVRVDNDFFSPGSESRMREVDIKGVEPGSEVYQSRATGVTAGRLGAPRQSEEKGAFERRKIVRPKAFKDRVTLAGIKPRLKFSVEMTPEEVKHLAEQIKAKWTELNESGILYDIDNFPALQDAVQEWGDVTTSIRLRYKNESVFEISFQTEDGYIAWVDYGVVEGAGVEPNTVFIELDFESLMRLKNNWEQGLKNAEGPLDIIRSLPGLFSQVVGMLMNGDIKVQPFATVFRIPKMLKVMFEAVIEGSGISI